MTGTLLDAAVFDGLLLAGTTQGVALTQLLCLAVRLELVDRVAARPLSAQELAAETACHEPSLRRVLRALVGCGVLARDGDRYQKGPHGDRLATGTEGSLRAPLVGVGDAWKVWGALEHSVRTGAPAFAHALGQREWDFLKQNPVSNLAFTEHMGRLSARKIALLRGCDLPADGLVVDVGGRDGSLLAALLEGAPARRGLLFDRPEMVDIASKNLAARGVADRTTVEGGDFFVSVPGGGDVYVLSSVLHDWNADECVAILGSCRAAMPAGARLLVVEVVLSDDDEWSAGTMLDLNMMVITGGRERTRSEWDELAARAGFRIEDVVSPGGFSVLDFRVSA